MAICGDFATLDQDVMFPTHEASFTRTETHIPFWLIPSRHCAIRMEREGLGEQGAQGVQCHMGDMQLEDSELEQSHSTHHPFLSMGRIPSCTSLTLTLTLHCFTTAQGMPVYKGRHGPITWLCPLPALAEYCRQPFFLSEGR